MQRLILIFLVLAVAQTSAAQTSAAHAQTDPRCAAAAAQPVEVVEVNERLELLLADGRKLALAGIEPALAAPSNADDDRMAAQLFLDAQVVGKPAQAVVLAAKPDRWGRVAAIVFAAGDEPAMVSLAEALLQKGLARIASTPPLACLNKLRIAETHARDNGLGVWAKDPGAMIDAADTQAFSGKNGFNIVVEGKVLATNSTDYRTYLNFGLRRYIDFSVTILKPNLKIFDKAGVSVQSLLGKTLRVRGMLDLRFGPQMEIASPDAIEVLD